MPGRLTQEPELSAWCSVEVEARIGQCPLMIRS